MNWCSRCCILLILCQVASCGKSPTLFNRIVNYRYFWSKFFFKTVFREMERITEIPRHNAYLLSLVIFSNLVWNAKTRIMINRRWNILQVHSSLHRSSVSLGHQRIGARIVVLSPPALYLMTLMSAWREFLLLLVLYCTHALNSLSNVQKFLNTI